MKNEVDIIYEMIGMLTKTGCHIFVNGILTDVGDYIESEEKLKSVIRNDNFDIEARAMACARLYIRYFIDEVPSRQLYKSARNSARRLIVKLVKLLPENSMNEWVDDLSDEW